MTCRPSEVAGTLAWRQSTRRQPKIKQKRFLTPFTFPFTLTPFTSFTFGADNGIAGTWPCGLRQNGKSERNSLCPQMLPGRLNPRFTPAFPYIHFNRSAVQSIPPGLRQVKS